MCFRLCYCVVLCCVLYCFAVVLCCVVLLSVVAMLKMDVWPRFAQTRDAKAFLATQSL